jgi:hypothetical protein
VETTVNTGDATPTVIAVNTPRVKDFREPANARNIAQARSSGVTELVNRRCDSRAQEANLGSDG